MNRLYRAALFIAHRAVGSRESFAAFVVALLVYLAMGTTRTGAQTVRIDSTRADSLVLTVRAGGTTHDSARVAWSYGARRSVRVIPANATDTVRWPRQTAPAAKADALTLSYTTYPNAKITQRLISARVVVPPSQPGPTGSWRVPTPPATFTVPYPVSTRRVMVPSGADLQAALNAARSGDELVLADGAVFTGNFVLPVQQSGGWVVVRCATPPAVGVRVTAGGHAAMLQTLNTDPALRTAPGAARWRVVCLQIAHAPTTGHQNYGIVVLGRGDETTLAAVPTDIVLDRVQIRGSTTVGNSRCVAFNGMRLALIHSSVTECHGKGNDAQGVGGWNGPGPFLIDNNRIEASGQGVMFGGADPRIANVSPSDITITRNYIYKPLAWGRGVWTVKAAFELKHGKRVLFEGNVIENHWADAQVGYAILFQTLADNNTAWAWTTVADVMVTNNVIRNSTSGANILARVAYNGGTMPTHPTSRVVLFNNVFENVGRDPFSGAAGVGVQLLADLVDVTIDRNSFSGGPAQKAVSFDGKPQTRTTITDNVFMTSSYVLTGNATGAGRMTLDVFMPGGVFLRNALPGARPQDYDAGAIGNAAGANLLAIQQAIAGVVR